LRKGMNFALTFGNNKRGQRMSMKETITSETCLTCGACCLPFEQEPFVDLLPEDLERLGPGAGRRLVEEEALRIKEIHPTKGLLNKCTVCACIALKGNPFHKVQCSIYQIRPHVCRDAVKPGTRICRKVRSHYERLIENFEED
jgi:Putative zinc- or iron-chelating domain